MYGPFQWSNGGIDLDPCGIRTQYLYVFMLRSLFTLH